LRIAWRQHITTRIKTLIQRTERQTPAAYKACYRNSAAFLLAFLAVTLVSRADALAQSTGPLPDRDILSAAPGIVVNLQFDGNDSLSDAELATVTATKVPGWFSRFIYHIPIIGSSIGSTYDTIDYATLQRDTAVLNRYYKDHGFLLAKSTFEVRADRKDIQAYQDWLRKRAAYRVPPTDDRGPLLQDTVIFHIVEGPAFTVSHVTFTGLENMPEEFQPELTEHETLKSGSRWNYEVAGAEAARIDSIMVENGYPYFRRDTMLVMNTIGTTTVNVEYFYKTGPRLKFGPVHIVYDTNTLERTHVADRVILAQLLVDTGWYRQSLVQRSEANLTHLNAFDLVRVSLDTSYLNSRTDSALDGIAVPVEVFLRLRLRAEVTPGVYAGTGNQGFVIGGTAGYNNRNLTGVADNIDFSLAYQALPSSQKRYSTNLDYTIPYIGLGRIPLATGVGGSYEEQKPVADTNVAVYYTTTYSAHVGSSIILSKLDNRTTLSPDITLQKTHSEGDERIRKVLPLNQYGLIPAISYQDDRTNDVFNPTSGHLFNGLVDVGVPVPGNTASSQFLRAVPLYKQYIDLSNKGVSVIAGRIRLGKTLLFSPDNPSTVPPPERRFYGGGSASVRGWPERSMLVSGDTAADPTFGGYNVVEGTLEWRYAPFQYDHEWTSWQKLSAPIRIVLFYDVGNVWDNTVPMGSQLAHTVGIGLRYNTLFGPLRFDWGLKLWDPSGQFVHQGYTRIKPSDKGAWIWSHVFANPDVMTFQFAIGQAF
jgi:outer membrane protein assembly factor BamA